MNMMPHTHGQFKIRTCLSDTSTCVSPKAYKGRALATNRVVIEDLEPVTGIPCCDPCARRLKFDWEQRGHTATIQPLVDTLA